MMCFGTLVAKGVKKIRFNLREGRTNPATQRDEAEVAREKKQLEKKARDPRRVKKRARRKQAKIQKVGTQNLHRQKLIH